MSLRPGYCDRCRRMRPVHGEGPRPCPVMLIGEGPGPVEDAYGRPFIHKSGFELDGQYLPMGGLYRGDTYVTNAIKCRQGTEDGDKPDPDDVACCADQWLHRELQEVQPEYVITVGAVALRLFGDYSLDLQHGLPLYDQKFGDWTGTVFPSYHMAAGLRQSEFMIDIQTDFRNLWLWRHGKLKVHRDKHPKPDYRELRTAKGVNDVLWAHGGWASIGGGRRAPWIEVAIDTETDEGRFWCLSFSLQPGTGYMLRTPEAIQALRDWIEAWNPLVIYHHYLYDAPVLEQVGIVTPRFTDTMVEAYHFGGILPQGLKALAYRECGMVMKDYEDVVMPYAIEGAKEYLVRAMNTKIPAYIEALPWKPIVRSCSGYLKYGGKHGKREILFLEPGAQTCGAEVGGRGLVRCTKLFEVPREKMARDKEGKQYIWDRAGVVYDAVIDKGANPLKRWGLIPAEERAVMEQVIGPMPRPSIANIPLEEAIPYACRDADATLRVKRAIRRLIREFRPEGLAA